MVNSVFFIDMQRCRAAYTQPYADCTQPKQELCALVILHTTTNNVNKLNPSTTKPTSAPLRTGQLVHFNQQYLWHLNQHALANPLPFLDV